MKSTQQIIVWALLVTLLTLNLSHGAVPDSISQPKFINTQAQIGQPNSVDVIWPHFLRKYSSSNGYLTQSEVRQLTNELQKCDSNHDNLSHRQVQDEGALDRGFILSKDHQSNSVCNIFPPNSNSNISSLSELNQICAQILYVIDNHDCCIAANQQLTFEVGSNEKPNPYLEGPSAKVSGSTEKPTTGEVWGFGFLFVTIISACSVVGVSVLPVMGKKAYKYILTTMIGLAVGSLTGSAVFHLMPNAFNMRANDPAHEYLYTALVVTGGIWMFFMVERILKLIMDYKDRIDSNKNPWKKPKMSINYSTPESSTNSILVENGQGQPKSLEEGTQTTSCSVRETEFIYETQEQAIKASFGHQDKPKTHGHDHMLRFEQGKDSVIATVAWMIIFGDGLHNFIDGLSIGAAFNESILTGVSISVAVFCEELPHELGDFAVLLNAGMTMRQALVYNFLSACTCYLGMAVGIFLGEVEASGYIFGVATGMFLYIALVDMVPEMNEVSEKASKISVKKGLFVLLIQNIGILVGIFALFILAKYQDNIKF